MRAINVFNRDPRNIGDLCSRPFLYIPKQKDYRQVAIWRLNYLGDPRLKSSTVVVGGGGLVGTNFFERGMQRILDARPPLLVLWGAGYNRHGASSIHLPDYLDRFDLVGLRDDVKGYPWVPCVSCNMAGLKIRYAIEHEVVVYNHQEYPTGVEGDFPVMTNHWTSIARVLRFLGSGETVITSSYHGAYWATLLGRKVVIVNPFSAKFYGFRHQPPIASASS